MLPPSHAFSWHSVVALDFAGEDSTSQPRCRVSRPCSDTTEYSAAIRVIVINADKHQQPRSPNPFNPALLLQEPERLHPNLLCHLL